MGLDLMLYKRKQWQKEHDWYEAEEERRQRENDVNVRSYEGELDELAYGRRTWAMYKFLANESRGSECLIDDYAYVIPKKAYVELCQRALPYEFYLKALNEADEESELDEETAEYIFCKVFDDDELPQLGYIWDCRALYKWCFENRDVIAKAFDEDEIVLIASW